MAWIAWINGNWVNLAPGVKLSAPRWLPSPAVSGFRPLPLASPEGQVSDWGLSFADGSRIHVHQFADGRYVVHRDRYDPDQGLGRMVAHLFGETLWGLGICLGVLALVESSRSR